MPAVNAELIFQAMRDAKADFNEAVYWSRPVDWKNQTLTPNPDTIYLMPIFNTKEVGPMVLEIPPADGGSSIIGSIDEAWQTVQPARPRRTSLGVRKQLCRELDCAPHLATSCPSPPAPTCSTLR